MPEKILIKNIKQLVNVRDHSGQLRGSEFAELPCIDDAWLSIADGLISRYGQMATCEIDNAGFDGTVVDASGKLVLPCWCDSHTHAVFAGSRENEFIDKLKGRSYAEIAANGGGILNSAGKLAAASEDELFEAAWRRLKELARLGTGSIEIKSGYGLSVAAELKMLRVIRRLRRESDMLIRATFLGAHALPVEYQQNRRAYIDLIKEEMLPAIAAENLADYIDVFCETGFFSAEQTAELCRAGAAIGLRPKLHVNQLNSIGGIEAGIANGALSLDHLETLTSEEIKLLGDFEGCSTLLPTAAFFLRMPMQPARDLINANAAVTLASDFNPGSSPSGNMNFVAALSCIQMKMLPEEVINAATLNGAYAMGVAELTGSITKGKRADLIFTKPVPSLSYLFYSFGTNHIDKVMLNGRWQVD